MTARALPTGTLTRVGALAMLVRLSSERIKH
jgi:hypothetical protein